MATKAGNSGMAARYALALLELADEDQKLDVLAKDLKALDAAIVEIEDLNRMITSPVIERDIQAHATVAILDKSGADELTKRFINVCVLNRRLYAIRTIIKAYLSELAKRRGELTAQVTTAYPLNVEQTRAIERTLQRAEGSNVLLSLKVDSKIIGGMVIKVGSHMIDFSIKTQLDKMKLVMKGAG